MEFTDILYNFGLGILPVSEIRGAIIHSVIGLNLDGLQLLFMYFVAVFANFLPVPFIILLFRPLLKFFKKFRVFRGICEWLEKRTHKKAQGMSESKKGHGYGSLALYIFVAIPLPTTGAWTGSMIAGLCDMQLRRALPAILLGIMTSGVVMTILCSIGAEALGFLSFLIR